MVDTNVLILLLVFSSKKLNQMMECIFVQHQLVLSSYIVEELKDVVKRKFPSKIAVIDTLLAKMSYEYVYTPDIIDKTLFEIRDVKDYPVLYTAILRDADIHIRGDRDFKDVDTEKTVILMLLGLWRGIVKSILCCVKKQNVVERRISDGRYK